MMWMISGSVLIMGLLGAGGTRTNDLVSLMDAKDYFAYHKIETTPERMTEVAGAKPTSPAARIQQLLAIRWLGRHAAETKKSTAARKTLEKIAAGKEAQDRFGFASEYARTALARVEGKPIPLKRPVPADSVSQRALSWFPDSATLFGALDLRRGGEVKDLDISPLRTFLLKQVPAREKEQLYEGIDKLGNIRLDRISFAHVTDASDKQKNRMFVRVTGLGSHRALLNMIQPLVLIGGVKLDERKGAKGEAITVLDMGNSGGAIAIVGDTDVLIAGYEGNGQGIDVINQALDVRAGKKDSIVKGSFADALKDVPAGANGLLMGDLPDEVRNELTGAGSPFKAVPKTISAVLTRGKVLEIKAEGVMASADDATTLADNIVKLKTMGLAMIGKIPPKVGVTPSQAKLLRQAIESVTAKADKDSVKANVRIPAKAMEAFSNLVVKYLAVDMAPDAPEVKPPPPAPPPVGK